MLQWRQMDIEYTFCQMLYLCSSPKDVQVSLVISTPSITNIPKTSGLIGCSLHSSFNSFNSCLLCYVYDHRTGHDVFQVRVRGSTTYVEQTTWRNNRNDGI